MNTNTTGSQFDSSRIESIRKKLKMLEDLIFATNIRTISFDEEYKVFTDARTFTPVVIKNGTKCIVSKTKGDRAYVFVRYNIILIRKNLLTKNQI